MAQAAFTSCPRKSTGQAAQQLCMPQLTMKKFSDLIRAVKVTNTNQMLQNVTAQNKEIYCTFFQNIKKMNILQPELHLVIKPLYIFAGILTSTLETGGAINHME